jgi:hypothetical protein
VTLPSEIKADEGGITAVLANSIIAHFLGNDWFAKDVRQDSLEGRRLKDTLAPSSWPQDIRRW